MFQFLINTLGLWIMYIGERAERGNQRIGRHLFRDHLVNSSIMNLLTISRQWEAQTARTWIGLLFSSAQAKENEVVNNSAASIWFKIWGIRESGFENF